jgi:CarboxypepD_reg-like domain/TonB dependent receptor-like, beta-barrel/TonB-dependent Receptor Plug Domain
MNVKPGINIWSILPWNKTSLFLLVLLLCSLHPLAGQTVEIHATEEPLNRVLLELASEYSVQLSFDDQQLSSYTLTLQKTFDSPQQAITFLIKDYPLEFKQIGEVYTIYRTHLPEVIKNYRLSGSVIDARTGETLPYSHVQINNSGVVTDLNGNFSFISRDSLFRLSISYLGYYIEDTTLTPGTDYILKLHPSLIGLKEVVIKGSIIERSGQIGEEAGMIRLNHKIAYRLPGNGDNAVFNFLRLQPGILAAGERSTELIIWGSYSGHSKIMFDGFTIYGLKNFNDNISFVNPYMAKDIKVLKGGFSSEYENRVGGIVDISGISGNREKPSINLNINNMTLNGMASIPINNKSSLTFAYRQTYYSLYDAEDLDIISSTRQNSSRVDVNVYPDYIFRDFNLKYAGSTSGGDNYFISLYQGKDQFSYEVNNERPMVDISQDAREENKQLGASAFYGKRWKSGAISHLSFTASGLDKELYEKQEVNRTSGNWGNGSNGSFSSPSSREVFFNNKIQEFSVKNKNHIPLSDRHSLEAGWNYTLAAVSFREDSLENTLISSTDDSHRFGLFVKDEYTPWKGIRLRPGVRIDYPFHLERVYIQPRIQASIEPDNHWRINGAAGIYNQFISETSVIDELGNNRYVWAICNNDDVPVLHSKHFVGGVNYKNGGLSINLEGFYKNTTGITRYVNLWRLEIEEVYQGKARMYGMDLLVKQYFKKHELWASYTLSKTEEYFPYMPEDVDYRDAPQDQRHEIKGALLLNFSPFFFTTNYVYGSGFKIPPTILDALLEAPPERYPYSRLDMAMFYRHSVKNYHFELGISVLNVTNHENIKYSNLIRIPDSQTTSISIHAEAVPFTPTIYLNMAF